MVPEPKSVPEMHTRRVTALPMTDPLGLAPNSCARTAEARPQPLFLACHRVIWCFQANIKPGRRRGRACAEDERAAADHMGGQRCRLSCVEAGPVAWSCGPTHAYQGVGRRWWKARAPDDGRRTCGTTLGRGIRPALSLFSLLDAAPCGETPPAAGRRLGPHGRIRTLHGATDTSNNRGARSDRWLRP